MKVIYLLIFILLGASCGLQTNSKTEVHTESNNSNLTPDASVALNFMNDYAEYCTPKSPPSSDTTWIERNQLLTNNFKNRYSNLLDSASKADPEIGLDFDPIFDAQDYPDEGFIISSQDSSGFVTLKGKDWPEFTVVVKVVLENNKPLVDGAGIINIPVDKRAKR